MCVCVCVCVYVRTLCCSPGSEAGAGEAEAAGVGEEQEAGAADPEEPRAGKHRAAEGPQENPGAATGGAGTTFTPHTAPQYILYIT